MRLYSYFRSSTAYRVRIGMHMKGLSFETIPVNLLKGEQKNETYLNVNPAGGVPALEHDGHVIAQSLAILEYINTLVPDPPFLHGTLADKALARQAALTIATDIHPVINLKVVDYLSTEFGADEAAKTKWYRHWVGQGLRAVEQMLNGRPHNGPYAMGDRPGLVDICIVPQLYSMRRMKMPLDPFPVCRRIEEACMKLDAFRRAAPENQPDTPESLEVLSLL